MKRIFQAVCIVAASLTCQSDVPADILLTFDQSGVNNFANVDQAYGDRIVATPDTNGHSYGLAGDGSFTPNVEAAYSAGDAGVSLWTTGYGSLENVLFAGDFATELRVDLAADEGFEVGLSGFDLAAFSSNQEIQGIEVLDGSSSVVWAVGVTEISGTSFNAFDTSGVFASSLSIRVDLTGQGTNADNFGIDNIQVSQRSVAAVPEPAAASAILLGSLLLFARRRKF